MSSMRVYFKCTHIGLVGLTLSSFHVAMGMAMAMTMGKKRNKYQQYCSMRKIKFTQQTIAERLGAILTDFPRLDDVHPFYADLCNTLYDRDHYKLALGQIHAAKNLVDQVARDMLRMVKHGDSLYRCKSLKRAALGRMCTILKRQKAALAYLSEVRKHMSRLPALDPACRTLLLCGLPNVGKSSFMNKITRANVDVQPYAFTTKSLYVGHCDHRYLRWQVVDTPGILDHPLEERNTIEMQAVTALAHLTCAVLYFMDVSEECGYDLSRQCALFRSIRPLFANKQLCIVVNKVDVQPWETLEPEKRRMIEELAELESGIGGKTTVILPMSNVTGQGVSEVKSKACDRLLAARVDARLASGNKVDRVMNRLQVFYPTARDGVQRKPHIPESVLKARQEAEDAAAMADSDAEGDENDDGRSGKRDRRPKRSTVGYAPTVRDGSNNKEPVKKTARDRMWENGGPGVWAPDYREQYDLKNDEWKFDAIPQIMDGKNIADFYVGEGADIDKDISQRLEELEVEEDQRLAELEAAGDIDNESDLDSEEEAVVTAIRERRTVARQRSIVNNSQNRPVLPRAVRGRGVDVHDKGALDADNVREHLAGYGVDATELVKNRGTSRRRRGETDDDTMDVEGEDTPDRKRRRQEQMSHGNVGKTPEQVGLKDETALRVAAKKTRRSRVQWMGASGEGDRTQKVHLVKWCNTGKKRMGTTYSR